MNEKLTEILKGISEIAEVTARKLNELESWSRTRMGTRQGDLLSPELFETIRESAMDGTANSNTGFPKQEGMEIRSILRKMRQQNNNCKTSLPLG